MQFLERPLEAGSKSTSISIDSHVKTFTRYNLVQKKEHTHTHTYTNTCWFSVSSMCENTHTNTHTRSFRSSPCQWLPLIIPGKVSRITTHVSVSADLFLVELMSSHELQHIDILPRFVLLLMLNQSLPSSLCKEIFRPLYPSHISHEGIDM